MTSLPMESVKPIDLLLQLLLPLPEVNDRCYRSYSSSSVCACVSVWGQERAQQSMRVGLRLAVVNPMSRPELREKDWQLALEATKGQSDKHHLWTAKCHDTGML